jgi:hypothetical protein
MLHIQRKERALVFLRRAQTHRRNLRGATIGQDENVAIRRGAARKKQVG